MSRASGARTARLSTIVVVRVVPGSADVTGPANDALHELIGAYAGRAIEAGSVPKIVGFDTPRHAVGFAVALVAACTQHGRQIATAVDIGEVADPIIDSDGGPVAAARRLAERAEPGEVLTSDVVRQLVGTYPGVRFIDQGRVRLPGRPDRARLWRIESSPQRRAAPATVGRDDELASLHELLSSLEGDTLLTRLVLFEGEAGIGKTHLLDRVRGYALDAGMLVVDARMDEVCSRVGTLPHAVLSVAERGDAYARRLAELLALVAHAETSDVSYSIVEATVDLADSLAAVQPVLVIADDLHWADELSLAVLRRIAPRVDSPAIGIVGAFRPAPRRPTLDLLIDGAMQHHVLRHHRLVGLGDADIVAMVAAQIGAAPGPKLRGSLTATAGSPLFVGALLQSLEDEGRLHIDGGVGEMVGEETPQALRDALLRRLSWLPVECRELLRIGSLLGGSFTLAELAAINHGATVVDTAATLREATAAGLLVGDGDRLAFRHDLVRDAVYADMLPGERRDLHRSCGQALASVNAPVGQIARQYALGARSGDTEAAEWLTRAGHDVLGMSPMAACDLYSEALDIAPPTWEGRTGLHALMIEPIAWCGDFARAEAFGTAVLAASPSPEVEFQALRGLSMVHGNRGSVPKCDEYLTRAIDSAAAPINEALRLSCVRAQLRFLSRQATADETRRLAGDALTHGIAGDDHTTVCIARQVLAIVDICEGYAQRGLEHLSAALAVLDLGRVSANSSYLMLETFHAGVLMELDEIDAGVIAAARARERMLRRGAVPYVPVTHFGTAAALYTAGRYEDAAAELETGAGVANDIGNTLFDAYRSGIAADIDIRHGNLVSAAGHIATGTRHLAGGGSAFGADWLMGTQTRLLAATGDTGAALNVGELGWRLSETIRYFIGHKDRAVVLARLAINAGRLDLADEVVDVMEEGARRSPAASAAAAALHVRGLRSNDPDMLVAAAERYSASPHRVAGAECRVDAAAALAGRHTQTAIDLLRDARDVFAAVGDAGNLSDADERLRSLGGRPRRTGNARPSTGWQSLTPTEHKVCVLLVEGLSNPAIAERLFVSSRTIETHLSHIFRKTKTMSRTQLATEYLRQNTPDDQR